MNKVVIILIVLLVLALAVGSFVLFKGNLNIGIEGTYKTPEDLYDDFRKSIIEQDFELFRKTIGGEAEENYGFSPEEDSYTVSRGNSLFSGGGIDFSSSKGEYSHFESIPKNASFILESNGQKVPAEIGRIHLKGGAKITVMKIENSWKVIED